MDPLFFSLEGYMRAHVIVPVVIITVSLLSVAAFVLKRWIQWQAYKPKEFYRGVGIIYLPGPSGTKPPEPWYDWRLCVDACFEVVKSHELVSQHADRLLQFWIEVVPYDGLVTNSTSPTGFLSGRQPAAAPRTEEEAKTVQRVIGSVKVEQFMAFTRKHYVIQVLQIPGGLTPVDVRLRRGVGKPRPMSQSAFFYEFARRHVPFMMAGNYVAVHEAGDRYVDLENRLHDKYRALHGAALTVHTSRP